MMTAKQIRKARTVLGWSQEDLARAADIPLDAVIVAEGIGPRVVPLTTTMAITEAFKTAMSGTSSAGGAQPKPPDGPDRSS